MLMQEKMVHESEYDFDITFASRTDVTQILPPSV